MVTDAMAARPEQPKVPEWCKLPQDAREVFLVFGGTGRMELPPSRRAWKLGRKDPTTPPNEHPHLILKGERCSRKHAWILRDIEGNVFLQDRGSTHGTWLGDTQLTPFEPTKWTPGTKAVFGGAEQGDTATMIVSQSQALQIPRPKRSKDEAKEQVSLPKKDSSQSEGPNHEEPSQPQRRGTPAEEDGQRAAKQRRLSIMGPTVDTQPIIGPRPEPQGAQDATGQQSAAAAIPGSQRSSTSDTSEFIGPMPPPKAQPAQTPQLQGATRPQRPSAAAPLVDSKQKSTAEARALPGLRPEQQVQQRQSVCAPARRVSTAAPPPESRSAPVAPALSGKPKKCDKCDGPHITENCPHFKKTREDHKDAWQNYGKKGPVGMGKSGGKLIIRNARYIRQPGDGSCLFHSLCFGLNGGRSHHAAASQLRRDLAQFIRRNPKLEVSGDTLEEWVRWDARTSVEQYTSRMAQGGWGGGIEMAACALLKKVNVHVYESRGGRGYERISCFEPAEGARGTVHVLYQGGVHYDALVVN